MGVDVNKLETHIQNNPIDENILQFLELLIEADMDLQVSSMEEGERKK